MPCKWKTLAVLCMAVFLFAGCVPFANQNINELLHAPALGQGIADIQKVLADYLGESPQYKFPKEGEWRSPYVLTDLDGDGNDEAILFFSTAGSNIPGRVSNNVYIALLAQHDGQWSVVQETQGPDSELASVVVASLYADDTKQLILGFASTTSLTSKTIMLYSYENEKVNEVLLEGQFTKFLLGDFTGTGRSDIALVSAAEESLQLNFLSGITTETGEKTYGYVQTTVALQKLFETCEALTPSRGPDGERLLVVDGKMKNNTLLISQILYLSGSSGGFYTLDDSSGASTEFANKTSRSSTLLISRDIDGDGMIEIPVDWQDNTGEKEVTLTNDYKLQYVEWVNFLSDEPQPKQFGVLDVGRGIYVRLPAAWQEALYSGRYRMEEGARRSLWKVVDVRTGEVLMELRTLSSAEIPPGESKRIPGEVNMYVFPGNNINVADSSQINVTTLI